MTKPLLGFIGQGYIGKNFADYFEKKKYKVVRYALESQYVLNKDKIASCDIVFIAVPTPTMPKGFDNSIVESVIPLIGKGKIAVIKSTTLPGSIKSLQKKYPKITILHSPEFLSEVTAAYEVAHPFSNIVGMSGDGKRWKIAAEKVLALLPKSPFSIICTSHESEIAKYTHNVSGFVQIIFFNLIYDLAQELGADWSVIEKTVKADPLIPNRYANPVHKGGRGAGGNCFVKDFAAFVEIYKKLVPKDSNGHNVLLTMERKNIDLLYSTKKDIHILHSVYGKKKLSKHDVI